MKLDSPRTELRQALGRVVDIFVRGVAPPAATERRL